VKTLGIDLSANEMKTGVCEIDWPQGLVMFLERPAKDEALVQLMADVHMTAINVPLGWPDTFVDAVAAHRDGRPWPVVETAPPLDRLPLRFRLTDVLLMADGARPLSPSTDRHGVSVMRGARLQHLAREAGIPIDRSGTAGVVAEVYPPEALRQWGLGAPSYKGASNAANLANLAKDLASRCGPMAASAAASLLGCDDDALDAFICAVMARAVLLGKTARPDDDELPRARTEGWIHVPTEPMEDIVVVKQ
jgi:predicted nuclease with RNAse H fold